MKRKKTTGIITEKDREFILANLNGLTVSEMSEKLGKTVATIQKVINTYTKLPNADSQTAKAHLRQSFHWKSLKREFTPDELEKIEDQYIKYVQQFQEDVVATEEVQILNLIKTEILMDRNLSGKMKLSENIDRYRGMVESLLKPYDGHFASLSNEEREVIMDLEDKIQAALNAEATRTTEFIGLLKEHNTLSQKVMGSRDQRVTQIINRKVSFGSLVEDLLKIEKQQEESRILELTKMSAVQEFKRLAQPHKYGDNQVDNPILTSDVIELLKEDEDNEEES